MPYCPKCKAEYREGFKICIDCKVPLVHQLEDAGEAAARAAASGEGDALNAEYLRLLKAGEGAYDGEDYAAALNLLNEASQIEADDAEVWALLGLTFQALGATREAWRSYKFALRADPDDVNTLWYAAQLLFEQEDYQLAMSFVTRYLDLEDDPAERKEAESLREEIAYQLREMEDLAPQPVGGAADPDVGSEAEIPTNEFTVIDDLEDEEGFDEEEEWVAEEPEVVEDEHGFLADLTLMLTDRSGKCLQCGTMLPTDAPYCYNCKKPHLYQPLPG